jgi:hypothetical protein
VRVTVTVDCVDQINSQVKSNKSKLAIEASSIVTHTRDNNIKFKL